ncbi:MAG: hypothetical protein ACR2LQ_10685 [Acidimicrobiales bacterium]
MVGTEGAAPTSPATSQPSPTPTSASARPAPQIADDRLAATYTVDTQTFTPLTAGTALRMTADQARTVATTWGPPDARASYEFAASLVGFSSTYWVFEYHGIDGKGAGPGDDPVVKTTVVVTVNDATGGIGPIAEFGEG